MKIRVIPDDVVIPCRNPKLDLAVDIALTTALRIHEITSLRIETTRGKRLVRVKVKGGRVCDVYFPERLRNRIVQWEPERKTGWLLTGKYSMSRMSDRTLRYYWAQAQDTAGIEREMQYRFHDLRHTAITRFYQKTKDIKMTQLYARHADIKMTQHYTHVREEEVWAVMEGVA